MNRITKLHLLNVFACLLLVSQVWSTILAPGLSLMHSEDFAIELSQTTDAESESECDDDKKEKKHKQELLSLVYSSHFFSNSAICNKWNTLQGLHPPEIHSPPPEV